jgi:hypothetical protein
MGDIYDIGYQNASGVMSPSIQQGDTFKLPFSVTNIFANGGVDCVIRGQLRTDYDAPTAVDFVSEIIETIPDDEIGTEVVFDSGVGSGFSGLVPGALVTRTLIHNGVSLGRIVANTPTTVTMLKKTYTELAPSSCVLVGILRCLLSLTAVVTAGITAGKYFYDCEIEDSSGFVFKPLRGKAMVIPEVTK